MTDNVEEKEPFSIEILSTVEVRYPRISNVYDTRLFTIRRESADILHVEEKSRTRIWRDARVLYGSNRVRDIRDISVKMVPSFLACREGSGRRRG